MAAIRFTLVLVTLILVEKSVHGSDPFYLNHFVGRLSKFQRESAIFTSPGLCYGACDKNEPAEANERKCSLGLETSAPLHKQAEHVLLCNVTLQASAKRGKIGRNFNFYALENKKVLLKWSNEKKNDRYGIVDFTNCSVVYAKIDDLDIHSSYVAAANNETIDIIVKNTNGKQCQSTPCKLTLDLEGNVVEDLKEWLKSPYNLTAMLRSPTIGHLAVDYTGSLTRTLRVYRIDDHGDIHIIREFPANDDRGQSMIEVSNTFQMLTVCYGLDVNVTCAQFDLNGTLKIEKTLSPSERLHSIKVHNYPGGGFLVMTTDCTGMTGECEPQYSETSNWYFDPDGEFVGEKGVGGFTCSGGGGFMANTTHFFVTERIMIFRNPRQQLCFSDFCPNAPQYHQRVMVLCAYREEFE